MPFHLSRAFIWQVLYPFSISCLQIVPFVQPPGVSADVRPAPSTRPANARIPVMAFMLATLRVRYLHRTTQAPSGGGLRMHASLAGSRQSLETLQLS